MRLNTELVYVEAAEAANLHFELSHRLTMLSNDSTRSGMTVWGTANRAAVIYWSWTLTDEGIPVLANQLAIRSNLLFRNATTLPYDEQLLRLNQVVHSLPWQPLVVEHVQRLFGRSVIEEAVPTRTGRQQRRHSPQRLAA